MSHVEAKSIFAAEIGCKVLIPNHHDFRKVDGTEKIEKFGEEFLKLVPDGTFIAPKHCEWLHI